jgi:hypothetical protein
VIEIAAIVGLFILRLGIPLAVTLLVAWWLRRLDEKWKAEAAAAAAEDAGLATRPQVRPATAETRPCWLVRNCPQEMRATCAGYGQTALPCWLARLRVEGKIPLTCASCALFQRGESLRQVPI